MLIDLQVSGNGSNRTGASWVKARPSNLEQLTLGTDAEETVRRSEEDS